jgi:hypothetical protein
MDNVRVTVTARPGTVRVEYKGEVHIAKWRDYENLTTVSGDACLLRAAMCAWSGEDSFIMTDEQLAKRSNGWWAVPKG